jgi:hypothetical protein
MKANMLQSERRSRAVNELRKSRSREPDPDPDAGSSDDAEATTERVWVTLRG